MADLDNDHDVRRLDGIDDAVVTNSEPPGAPEAVSEGFAEFDGMSVELALDRLPDTSFRGGGKTWNVFPDDAFQILDLVLQSHALL
jgi:hypothetical protein